MNDKSYIIAIDSGTQSIRAVLFDRHGTQIALEQADYEPYFSLSPGWAEQRTEDYWTKLCLVCKGLMAKIDIDLRQVCGIGLTSQRNTVIPMDKDGNALRPGIIWLDQRTVANVPPLGKLSKLAIKLAGQTDALRYAQKNSKFLWIKQNEPEIYRKTHKFVQASGFFARKLTGEFRDSYGMISGIYPFDYKALRLYGRVMSFIYDALGIEKKQCVDLYPPDKVLGYVTAQAAQETGLPEGMPVVVAAGDKQCELLGAGAIDPSIAEISFGTGTAMEVITRKYISDGQLRFFTWPAAVPKAWNIEMFITAWFLDGNVVQAGVRPTRGHRGTEKRRGARGSAGRGDSEHPSGLHGSHVAAILVSHGEQQIRQGFNHWVWRYPYAGAHLPGDF